MITNNPFLLTMIVRLTKLVINDIPIRFDPYVMEIPNVEILYDGGYYYLKERLSDEMEGLENLLEDGWFIDDEERLGEVLSDVKDLVFDFDDAYEIICE